MLSSLLMKTLILGLVLAVVTAPPVAAQDVADADPSPVTLRGAEAHVIEAPNGTVYEVRVAFPDGYDPDGEIRYPTLYVTDANFVFLTTVEAQRLLQIYGEVPPVLIVGVDRPSGTFGEMAAHRVSDLTPSSMPGVDSVFSARYGFEVRSGGAGAFLDVLTTSVVPFVESRYPTGDERGLLGYSVGGLLATEALFDPAASFTHYLIASPAYWWGGGEMADRERAYAATHRDLAADVFLSAGSLEPSVLWAVMQMDSVLASRGYQGLRMTRHAFDGETHTSVPPAAISRGLRVLFGREDEE